MSLCSISVNVICIISLTTYILINSQFACGSDDTKCSRCPKSSVKNSERVISNAFDNIVDMCNRLELVTTIKFRAQEIIRNLMDKKSLRGRNHETICAACIYLACRIENKPRTIAEIVSVTEGATTKEICRASEFIRKQLRGEGQIMDVGVFIQAGDFLGRFGSNVGMNFREVKAAREALQKVEELDIRKSPKVVAATVIYIISQLSSNKYSLKEVSSGTGVRVQTIRNSYNDLTPYLVRIIPGWYASEDEIKRIKKRTLKEKCLECPNI